MQSFSERFKNLTGRSRVNREVYGRITARIVVEISHVPKLSIYGTLTVLVDLNN